jgi:hypothetical protein
MLKSKPQHVDISEHQRQEMMQNVRDGIYRKLKSAKQITAYDKELAAGLYVYAVEEFGKLFRKLFLLKKVVVFNGIRRVIYDKEFVNHGKKFETAFDYFQANGGHDTCLVISEGDFVVSDIVWKDFEIGMLANTQARLSIFYSDFAYDDKHNIRIERPADVDLNILQKDIDELEKRY